MKTLVIALSLVVSSLASARTWERIEIPGAFCGDGSPYAVFLDRQRTDKILIEFMGGGACWSESTCKNLDNKKWISHMPELPAFSYMTADFVPHLWNRHTALYFPYCTGDVFAGKHVAYYGQLGRGTWHMGYSNVVTALNYIRDLGFLNLPGFKDVTVWGASAGGIGALTHSRNIEAIFPGATQWTLLADSPGLHFGDKFFDKFSPQMRDDFTQAFGAIGLFYPEHSGFVAPYMGPVFENLSRWKIGVLQSTRDIVMSVGFGELSPIDHERRVVSSDGIQAVSRAYSNVKVWISRSYMHTFLLLPYSTDMENNEQQSAIEFAEQIYRQSATP